MPELAEIVILKTLTNPSIGATVDNPTTVAVSSSVNALFDAVTTAEASAGDIEYRCIYIKNESTTESLISAELFLQTEPTSGTVTLSFGLGAVVTSLTMALNPAIADESTAPAGITFSIPTSASPLSLTTIPAGSYLIVWLKRIVAASTVAMEADYSRFVVRW
jgi:hypothetical protein